MAVVSAAMYKAARGIASGITAQDTNITAAIGGAESLIEAETGRKLATSTITEYFDTRPGQTVLYLSHWPVTTFTSLAYRSGNDWTLYSSGAYYAPLSDETVGTVELFQNAWSMAPYGNHAVWMRPTGRHYHGFPSGNKSVRAIYVAGYASGELATHLLEPFYSVVDWVKENWGAVRTAQQDGVAGVNRVNRAASDERERLQMLMRPFRSVVL